MLKLLSLKLKSLKNKKKSGEVAVEWIMLSPIIFFLVFFCIMYLIFVMDKILLSNGCTDLAQYLNMGDTGYKNTHASMPNISTIDYEACHYSLPNATGTYMVRLDCQPGSPELMSSYYFYVTEMLRDGRFNVPFCSLKELNCKVYSGVGGGPLSHFSVDPLKTESGDMVEIEVAYKFLWFNISQKGYSFII